MSGALQVGPRDGMSQWGSKLARPQETKLEETQGKRRREEEAKARYKKSDKTKMINSQSQTSRPDCLDNVSQRLQLVMLPLPQDNAADQV